MTCLSMQSRLLAATLVWVACAAAQAATITVTTSAADTTPNDGTVSIHEAIAAINAGNDLGDPNITAQGPFTGANAFGTNDTINFNIAGAGLHTITPAFVMILNKTVTIDGYSQAGATPNTNPVGQGLNTVLTIELAGPNAIVQTSGAGSAGTVIRGLVVAGNVGFVSTGNKVEGSFIGTNAAGTAASGQCNTGVIFGAANNTAGGTTSAARNLISGCSNAGVGYSVFASQDNNVIQGNLIGTNAAGTAAIPNGAGISVSGESAGTIIGGSVAGAGNVVSGNTNGGIVLAGAGTGAVVQGNLVGTDVTGTVALGNASPGVSVGGVQINVLIGGTAAGAGNVISGNGQYGVVVSTTGNTVQGNFIGTNAAGTAVLGIQTIGIGILSNANNNLIGGTAAGAANIIAFHTTGIGPIGISVAPFVSGIAFVTNSIHDNGGTGGILFGQLANSTTAAPALTSASISAGNVTLSGQFNQTLAPNATFRLEFFSNVACDAFGTGEGETFLGFQTVTSDAGGQIPNFGPFSFPVPVGQTVFTATTTSNPGSLGSGAETSTFSTCINSATALPPVITKNFQSATIQAGALSQAGLAFTINNPNVSGTLTGIAFTDTLPAGLVINTPNGLTGSCSGVTATAGGNVISMSGGAVGAGLTCNILVTINAPAGTAPGLRHNVTGNVTSTEGGAGNSASSDITVQSAAVAPPLFSNGFNPQSIQLNDATTLTFTITNTNPSGLTGISFSDTLPAGLVVATPNGLSGTCGGSVVAVAGTGIVSLSGGILAAGDQCTFSVSVSGTTPGTKHNVTGNITSIESGAGSAASSNVVVAGVVPPLSPATSVPSLQQWALWVLGLLILIAASVRLGRRRS
jgi:uncharacterized repeat protein (TIGR01451 family)